MKKLYYSWVHIQEMCVSISMQMYKDNWRPDYIVGITRGGCIPAVIISHLTGIPMRPLEVSLRDGGQCVSDLGMAEDAFGYVPIGDREFNDGENASLLNRKKILIVDDINDTGATFNWIKKDWPSGCHPNDPAWNSIWGDNVRFAVLTNNLSSSFDEVSYFAKEVNKAEDDVWLVYPWEH